MLVDVKDVADKSFDYVIVGEFLRLSLLLHVSHEALLSGGGTAGLVLAARLTEDPSISVCVLEGGAANLDDPIISMYRPVITGVR